jgi:hypothetical protein
MNRYTKAIRIGIVCTLSLLFVMSILPGLFLEPVARDHYYGGLLLGACVMLITGLLAREW